MYIYIHTFVDIFLDNKSFYIIKKWIYIGYTLDISIFIFHIPHLSLDQQVRAHIPHRSGPNASMKTPSRRESWDWREKGSRYRLDGFEMVDSHAKEARNRTP